MSNKRKIIESFTSSKSRSGVFLTVFQQLLTIVCGLGTYICLAIILGTKGNGEYSIVLILSVFTAKFFDLGISSANTYFVSSRLIPVRTALKTSFTLWLILSLIGIALLNSIIHYAGNIIFPGISKDLLMYSLIMFPLFLIQFFLLGIVQGIQDFKRYNLVILCAPLSNLLFITLIWFLHGTTVHALVSSFVSSFIGSFLAIILLKPNFILTDSVEHTNYLKSFLTYGWRSHLSNILSIVSYKSDTFLVNYFSGSSSVGIYVVAVQVAESVWLLSHGISTVIFPHLSRLYSKKEYENLLTLPLTRWTFNLMLLGAFILSFAGKPIIAQLFGESYRYAYDLLLCLLPGIVMLGIGKILASDFAAQNKAELNLYSVIIAVIFNLSLNVILIPKLGNIGASLSTSVTYIIHTIVLVFFFTHESKWNWKDVFLMKREDFESLQNFLK